MRFKLYSRRQAELNGEISDVFSYDPIPAAFRNQFYHIIRDVVKDWREIDSFFALVEHTFCREKGLKKIYIQTDSQSAIYRYIDESNTDGFIDMLDLILNTFLLFSRDLKYSYFKSQFNNAIGETNYRFKFNNLGYEFLNGTIVRIDSQVVHASIVKPALSLISDNRFSGANDEMRKAYEYRRTSDNKNAIIEACKAFESIMKSICTIKAYPVDPRATASALIQTLKDNSYFPSYLETHVNSLKATLESGLPTVRNRNAGHGQGEEVVSVPDAYVDYALNLLATNIVFLVKLLNL